MLTYGENDRWMLIIYPDRYVHAVRQVTIKVVNKVTASLMVIALGQS